MKYVKVIILIYCFTQLAFCMCRNLSAGKAAESNSVGSSTNESISKKDLLKLVKNVQNDQLMDTFQLYEIFPKQLIGLDFDTIETHTTEQLGAMIVSSQISYKKNDKAMYFRVMDIGSHPDYLLTLAPWSLSESNKTTPEGGYEKSMIVNGDKTLESYDPVYKVAKLSVIYDDRIVVTIFGTNLSIEQLHSVID